MDLLTANDTFLNERLARHYGVPGVTGSRFRRVHLADDARRGLLGKGAILLATSHATTTSPVLRGKWVLDNILGAPPPAPPPDVPALQEPVSGRLPKTMRAQMEQHRTQRPVRELPQADGPDRLRLGELRCRGRVAHHRVGCGDRQPPTSCWTAPA